MSRQRSQQFNGSTNSDGRQSVKDSDKPDRPLEIDNSQKKCRLEKLIKEQWRITEESQSFHKCERWILLCFIKRNGND